jgi:hypothetical protein
MAMVMVMMLMMKVEKGHKAKEGQGMITVFGRERVCHLPDARRQQKREKKAPVFP